MLTRARKSQLERRSLDDKKVDKKLRDDKKLLVEEKHVRKPRALTLDKWIHWAQQRHLLLSVKDMDAWLIGETRELLPVDQMRFNFYEKYSDPELLPGHTYSPQEIWNHAVKEKWTLKQSKRATSSKYTMLPNCKIGPQKYFYYLAEVEFPKIVRTRGGLRYQKGQSNVLKTALSTEPGQYFVALRASGDGYTRYMSKDAVLSMPFITFPKKR